MKKLMFAMAAVAAGAAFADPEIASANIVGYTTAGDSVLPDVVFGASFDSVDESGILPFNKVTVPGDAGIEFGDQIQAGFYNEELGITDLRNFAYYGEWYDIDVTGDPIDDTVGLALGESAWFISSGDPKTVTTAGQVYQENKIHTFTMSDNLCASAFPVAFCPNNENVSWDVSDGAQIQAAYYNEELGITDLRNYAYYGAWYDIDVTGEVLAEDDAVAQPGTGFWLILGDETETFSEVCPIAK